MTEKYIINIDFPTNSKIHLNSKIFDTDNRCIQQLKNRKDGGWVEYSESEVSDFLKNKVSLIFDGKRVTNLTTCNLCSESQQYNVEH